MDRAAENQESHARFTVHLIAHHGLQRVQMV
jgi:hypothetical protein